MIREPWPWEDGTPRENIAGTYRFNPDTGRVEKVSDRADIHGLFSCYCPRGGYWSENMGDKPVWVESRSHKRRLLKEHGLREHDTRAL